MRDWYVKAAPRVHIYRPLEAQETAPNLYQFSVVNNTTGSVTVNVTEHFCDGQSKPATPISLTAGNTAGSYLPWGDDARQDPGTFILDLNGTSIPVQDGAGYEVFTDASGKTSVRQIDDGCECN